MTQQQSKRDAQNDINYLKNSHEQDVLEVTVQAIAMADYWIKEAESQRIRAEQAEGKNVLVKPIIALKDAYQSENIELMTKLLAAEQERDKLIENIRTAKRVLLEDSGALTFESVAEMLDIVLKGGATDVLEKG